MVTPNVNQPGTPLRLIGVDVPLQQRVAPDNTQLNMRQSLSTRDGNTGSRGYRPMPQRSTGVNIQLPDWSANNTQLAFQQKADMVRNYVPDVSEQAKQYSDANRERERALAYDAVQRLALSHKEKLARGDVAGLTGLREDVVDTLSQFRFLSGDDVRELQGIVFNDYREEQDYRVEVTRKEARETRDAVIQTQVNQLNVRAAGIQEAVRMAGTPEQQAEALAALDALAMEVNDDPSLDSLTKATLLSNLYQNTGSYTQEAQRRFWGVYNMAEAQYQIHGLQEQWRQGEISASQLNAQTQQISQRFGFTPPQLGEAATNAMYDQQERTRVIQVANDAVAQQQRTSQLQLERIRMESDTQTARDMLSQVRLNQQQFTRDQLSQATAAYSQMTPAERTLFANSPTGRSNFGQAVQEGHKVQEEFRQEGSQVQRQVMDIDIKIQEIQQEDLNAQLSSPEGRDDITRILAATNPQLAQVFNQQGQEGLTPEQRVQIQTAARESRQRQIQILETQKVMLIHQYQQRGIGLGLTFDPSQVNVGNNTSMVYDRPQHQGYDTSLPQEFFSQQGSSVGSDFSRQVGAALGGLDTLQPASVAAPPISPSSLMRGASGALRR